MYAWAKSQALRRWRGWCVQLSAAGCLLLAAAQVRAEEVTPPRLVAGQALHVAAADGARGVSGRIVVEVLVDASGAVESASARVVEALLEPAPSERAPFEASALAHARGLRFEPARRAGSAIPARIRLAVVVDPGADRDPASQLAAAGADAPVSAPLASGPIAGAQPAGAAAAQTSAGQTGGVAAQGSALASSDMVAPPNVPSAGSVSAPAEPLYASPVAAQPDAAPTPGTPGAAAQPPRRHAHAHTHAHTHALAHVSPPMAADHAAASNHYGARARLAAGTGPSQASAASDLEIEIGALRSVPRSDAESYLGLSPGVVLANHSGIGHASGIYLRGFDAGEGQDLEFRVDGIPINEPSNSHLHGYADTQFVIPETVERVRVQQGPFDPRQGDFAVAGSALYTLGVSQRGLTAQFDYGRFEQKRGLLLWAPRDATTGTFAALDLRQGDGFGPNRAYASVSALGRFARAAGPLHYALLAGSHALQFDSAGVLRDDDYRARRLPCPKDAGSQFFCVEDPQQGGSAYRHLLGGKLSWARPGRRYELQVYGMLRGLRMRENFTGALLDARGDGLDEGYKATTLGALASYTLTPLLFGRKQRFEAGIEGRHDAGLTHMWRMRSVGAIPYATVFDRELALTHVAGYLRGEFSPLAWFSLRGGARMDAFGFHTEDQAAPASDRIGPRLPTDARDAWGTALTPRAALVLHLAPFLDWSVGGGVGVRSTDAEALSQGENAPFSRVIALETGPSLRLQARPRWALESRAFVFTTHVDQDLVFDPARGRNVPVGESNRYGLAFMARSRVAREHDSMASVSWSDARSGSQLFALGKGETLPFVPRLVLRVDHASSVPVQVAGQALQLTAAGGMSWIGPRPLPLGESSSSVWELDLAVRARWRWLELGVSLENVFDVRNRVSELNYASNFAGDDAAGSASMRTVRHFAAGRPRTWWLSLKIHLDDSAEAT